MASDAREVTEQGYGGAVEMAIMHGPGWATGDKATWEDSQSPLSPSSLLPETHRSARYGREAAAMLETAQGCELRREPPLQWQGQDTTISLHIHK